MAKKETAPEFKFGVSEAAKEMKVGEHTCRAKLRDAKVKKSGKSYGWKDRAAMLKAIKPAMAA